MRKVWWLLLLLIPTVSAYTIADWPSFYVSNGKFNAIYVVGEESSALDVVSATIISSSLAKFENVTTEVGTSKLDSEISDVTIKNAIVIGSPCDNTAAAQLMGNPVPCYKNLGGSVGYIKLFEKNGKVQLLITGLKDKDRNAAAKFVANANLKSINFTEYVINSNSGSTPAFFDRKLLNKTINQTPEPMPAVSATPEPANVSEKVVVKASPIPGAYEPLETVPKVEKKGFWARLWAWLKSIFT